MDFFYQQEKAKRYTKILLLYFLIAILLIVVAVNVVIYYFFIFLELYPYTPRDWFSSGLIYYISIATCCLIISGTFYRWQKLRSGGDAVAKMVGAKRLDLHTSDASQRKLINVVEEMSIASGVPLPTLYVLENEPGINAFVAGYLPTQAVMVVTDGAIEKLTRDEMQGVVAHEYSHILNGDMQINIRLMSLLAGILMISAVGRLLLEGSRSSRSSKNSGSALIVLGGVLLIIGYIGVFFGRMIKAAVSRQREYLADAASVQFTRNPQGIVSALYKIFQLNTGSGLRNIYAEDMSHMCFSQAIKSRMASWLATHPPLVERIRKIDPSLLSRMKGRELTEKNRERNQKNREVAESVSGFSPADVVVPMTAHEFVKSAGQVDHEHIKFAGEIHKSFSESLMSGIHQTDTARIIVLNMILVRMDIQSGMDVLAKELNPEEFDNLKKYQGEILKLDNYNYLPLFDLLLPSLKLLAENESRDFMALCEKLIKSDKRYTLFEFFVLTLLGCYLSSSAGSSIKIKYYSFSTVMNELQLIFSIMFHCSGSVTDKHIQLYNSVMQGYSTNSMKFIKATEITPKKIKNALQKLAQLSPLLKKM